MTSAGQGMDEARRLAYLDALGIDVYVRRSPDVQRASGAQVTAAPEALEADVSATWAELRATVASCQRCPLHATRTQTVFGVGNQRAQWMFIGEAPGADEDRQGEPFVGRAGQLLNSMLRAVGLSRDEVYIANILKCRPPGNRDPKAEEAGTCRGYLERQIELVNPRLIVAVGRISAQTLLETDVPLGRLRGKVHSLGARQWPLVVVYHPAYLLRSPGEKRKAWQDLLFAKGVFRELDRGGARM